MRKLGFYVNNVFLPLCMQGTNCLADSFCPSDDELKQFLWVYMSDETCWDPSNVSYPSISAMYHQTMQEETYPVGHKSIQTLSTLSTSNETIETGMDMCNLYDRMVKEVNISKA